MSTLPPSERQPGGLAVHPLDGGPAYCRRCNTALAADATFCPNCGLNRIRTDDPVVIVENEPPRVIEPVPDATSGWVLAAFMAVAAIALIVALVVVASPDDDGPATTVVTNPSTTRPIIINDSDPAPPAPVIIQTPTNSGGTTATTVTPTTATPTTAAPTPAG